MLSIVLVHFDFDRDKPLLTITFNSGVMIQYFYVPEEVYIAFKLYRERACT